MTVVVRARARSRWTAGLLAGLVAVATVVIGQATPAFAAAITVTKTAPAGVLVGEPIPFRLSAANPAGGTAAPEYNLTFRDVLPAGVTYVAGSTTPATAGEPDVRIAADGRQVLIWSNVGDLPVGSTVGLTFSAQPDPATYPVGATVSNTANAYSSTNPRNLAKFTAQGAYSSGASEQASSATTNTSISAIEITKSEPSPEHELLRGVHDHSTVYTLRTRNNTRFATTGVQVVDLLPAQLEFLGCGTDDNSAAREYTGAAPLSAVPDLVTDCPTPTSVTTVVDPPGAPAGTYTRVVWSLGTLAANQEKVITYRAGIPQRANVATWPGAAPTGASLRQAANLDNNTGASTRETTSEQALTNVAAATGTYQGPVKAGGSTSVSDTDQLTVTAEDLALQKSVSPGSFTGGGVATWTLRVSTGEYASAAGVVLTDVLPDGLCPLSSTTNFSDGDPSCDPVPGSDPTGASYAAPLPSQNADGTYDIVFTPLDLGASQVRTVTFQSRMRPSYADAGMDPTVSGDGYTNTVSLLGTTTVLPAVEGPGNTAPIENVADTSSASLASDAPSIDKRIQPDTGGATPVTCSTDPNAYVGNLPASDARVTFDEGDRICFLVRVDFSGANSTRNPVVTDFLPPGTAYEAGSARPTSNSTVTGDPTVDGAVLTWLPGTASAGGRYLAPGAVLEYTLSVVVTDPAPGPQPDVTGNLAKLRYENTDGAVFGLRDRVDFALAAAPPIGVLKSARRTAGTAPVPTAIPDGGTVRGGDTVEYTVTATNNGAAATRNAVDVVGPDVWDVVPAGITCADISAISDGGVCRNPADAGYPVPRTGLQTRSVVRWDLPDTVVLAPGASKALTYEVLFRPETSVSTSFVNNAAVSTYRSPTNQNALADHAPGTNIARDVTTTDAAPAEDTHRVVTPNATVAKTLATQVAEAGNNGTTQGTVGEQVTYTYRVDVPRGTTVYAGRLSDALPAGVTLVPGSPMWTYYPDAASPVFGVPPGTFTLGADGTLTFPATWTNDTSTDQRFEVTLAVLVADSGVQGATRTNTARFDSTAGAGGAAITPRTAAATFTLVVPDPSLTKTEDDADDVVVVGQELTYTLTSANTAGRPPLHDAFVVDCLPDGLTLVASSSSVTPRDVSAGDGTNGCPAGATRLEFSLGDLAGGAAVPITYRARVNDTAGGSQRYTNTAELSGSTMDDDKPTRTSADRTTERTWALPASTTVTVQPAAVDKTAARATYTIGERARWSVAATIPAQVNFYDAAMVDQLPAGIDASTVRLEDATCVQGGTPCSLPGTPQPLTSTAGPAGSTYVGWSLGDLTSTPAPRVVTLTYTAVVADTPDNSAGDVLTNTATLKWDQVDGSAPTRADDTFTAAATPDSASVTVTEPSLSLAKAVDDATPAPGQDFTYTVTLTNAPAGSNASAAHDVVVTDAVPSGVVVDAARISGGGVLTGADATLGGGTITWTVTGPVAAGGSVALTYHASLASPASPGVLVNTADIGSYRSLPGGGRTYDGPSATRSVRAALPRVTIDKTAVGSTTAYIGEPQQWRLVITSAGDSTAYGVDASDRLPQGWTYDSGSARVSVAGGAAGAVEPVVTTTGGAERLDWADLGTLPVGATLVVTYSATPGSDVVTAPGVGSAVAHTNTGGTTAEDAEGEQADASGRSYAGPDDTASVHVDSADLRVAKTHTGTAVAGQPLSWTVRVTNDGTDPAVGPWTVTDTLPAALATAPVTASGTGWTCGRVARDITCTRPGTAPLASGSALPDITVTATIPADVASGTTLTNTATVDGRTYDPRPGNDTATDDVTVTTSADLRVAKAVSGPVVAGRDATWTVAVDNRGPSVARAPFTVTDTLPAGVTFRSATGTGWTCAAPVGRAVSCTYGADLAVGASAPEITVVAGIPSGQVADVVNAVAITATTTGDPVPGNDTDSVTTTPDAEADLGLAKTRLGDVVAGQDVTYELQVHNFGSSDAAGVAVTDTLPAGLTYVDSTSRQGTWTCAAPGGVVTCRLGGTLAAGATATVEVRVAVASSVTGAVVNSATVGSTTRDPNPANDTDDDDSAIDVQADLAITKDHAGRVLAGGRVTYSLRVTNEGPSDSPGPIVASDVLPDGMTLVSATGAGWTCGPAAGVSVSCSRPGPLADGAAAPVITVVADVASDAGPATLVNRADVEGPADPNVLNDTASDPTVVEDEADVAITKSATDPTPVAGTTTAFALVVTNAGPSDADDVRVVDDMPAGLTAASASGTGWSCTVTAGSVTCERPTLAAGATAPTITVRATIDSSLPAGTAIRNAARVSTATDGDLPGDDTDDADLTLQTATDLSVTKTHTDRAVPGTSMRFTLTVANGGPSDVAGQVTVVDTLPAGMTFLSGTGAGWTCDAVADRVTCRHDGPLVAGQQLPPVELTVQLAPGATGDLVNRASVDPRDDDTDAGNDSTSDTVTLSPEVDLSVVKTHTGPVRVGERVAFTLTVRNAGPSTATGVVVRDPLPTGLDLVSVAGTGWTCAADGASCRLDRPLAPGATAAPLTVTATVRPAAYPQVTNVATVGSDGTETAPQDNTGRDVVDVPSLSNLTVEKTHQGELVVGGTVRYDIRVSNTGPTADPGPLTVTDVLPAGLSYVAGSGGGWTCVGGATVVCTREGALAAGASVDLALEVAVAPEAYPSVRNVASVDSPSEETDVADNQDDDVAPVVPVSALSLDKKVRSVSDSGRVVYDIEVTNGGPSATVDPVRVVDDLPAQLDLVEVRGSGWDCTTQGDVATCTHTGSLAVDGSASFVVTTQLRGSARVGQHVVNTAVLDVPDGPEVADEAAFTVPDQHDPAAGDGGGGGGDDVKGEQADGPSAGGLPDTGGPAWWLSALAALLVLTGAGLVTAARRRA